MTVVVEILNEFLVTHDTRKLTDHKERFNIDLSTMAIFNGMISIELPSNKDYKNAYTNDNECQWLIKMATDPSKISNRHLNKVHHTYRQSLQEGNVIYEQKKLYLLEPVARTTSKVKLLIVPKDLRIHVFVSYHVNPLGGHFGLYHTFHKIKLCYCWPNMYKEIKYHITLCVACTLKNHRAKPSSKLLYSFLIGAPFIMVHRDVWIPGKTMSFHGFTALMIILCHMTGFTVIEPMKELNAAEFARVIFMIMM
eukprot:13898781-Ditylum_brightwellii.AAC.1